MIIGYTILNSPTRNEVKILFNQGAGEFELLGSEFIIGGTPRLLNPRELIIDDFNGDGDPDVFIAAHGVDAAGEGEQNALLLSNGRGRLVDRSDRLPDRIDFSHSTASGDIDGDGDADIVVGNLGGVFNRSYFLINDGAGNFTSDEDRLPARERSGTAGNFGSVLLVDLDADDALDLVIGDHAGLPSRVYFNDGGGSFADDNRIDLPIDTALQADRATVDIRTLDANGDGLPDLLLANYSTRPGGIITAGHLQLLLNDGAGGFRDASQRIDAAMPAVPTRDSFFFVEIFDINGDGHPDILNKSIVGSGPNNEVTAGLPFVLVNDGRGRFSGLTIDFFDHQPASGAIPSPLEIVDADGDGGLDFISAGFRFELLRQLKPYGTGPEGTDPALRGAPGFNEAFYLNENPDVAALVDQGRFASGLDHYLAVGRAEGREIMAPGTRFAGTPGDDVLRATTGDETAFGRGGADRLLGRAGDDLLFGNGGADVLLGQGGDDRLVGGRGGDTLRGGAGSDQLQGQGGPDLLIGGAGGDRLEGNADPDHLSGGPGPDVLLGGAGRDVILGNRGDDVIIGGLGADHLSGGSGRDRFLYMSLDERGDEISDFEVGPSGDRPVLRDLLEGFVDGVSDPSDFLALLDRGTATVVRVNPDGQGADNVRLLTLQGVTGTTLDDLVSDGNVTLG